MGRRARNILPSQWNAWCNPWSLPSFLSSITLHFQWKRDGWRLLHGHLSRLSHYDGQAWEDLSEWSFIRTSPYQAASSALQVQAQAECRSQATPRNHDKALRGSCRRDDRQNLRKWFCSRGIDQRFRHQVCRSRHTSWCHSNEQRELVQGLLARYQRWHVRSCIQNSTSEKYGRDS